MVNGELHPPPNKEDETQQCNNGQSAGEAGENEALINKDKPNTPHVDPHIVVIKEDGKGYYIVR